MRSMLRENKAPNLLEEQRSWLYVRLVENGALLTEVDVSPSNTVLELGDTIIRKAVLPCRPRLLFNGQLLELSDTMEALGISDQATVMVSLPQAIVTASCDSFAMVWNADTGLCEKTLEGHGAPVHDASFSPDNANIVTASEDGTARIWNAATGQCKWIMRGHTDVVNSATYSPHSKWIVTTSADRTAKVWIAKQGECMTTLRGHECDVFSACFKDIYGKFDGISITTVSRDFTTKIWNMQTGVCDRTVVGAQPAYSASFSADGSYYAIAPGDSTAQIFRVETGELERVLEGHEDQVMSAAFAPPRL